MLSGSQRNLSELNSVDDPSGEGYALSLLVTKHIYDDRAIEDRQGWYCLSTMFVNNGIRSHTTSVAEDNG